MEETGISEHPCEMYMLWNCLSWAKIARYNPYEISTIVDDSPNNMPKPTL